MPNDADPDFDDEALDAYDDVDANQLGEGDEFAPVSKSQRKRDMHALLQLCEKALELGPDKLAKTGLSEKALKAFAEVRGMKASGARNRQFKYITKLVSQEDSEVLEQFVNQAESGRLQENRRFHQLENWRDRLLSDGDEALAELLNEYPHADRQQLRALMRQARSEQDAGKPPAAARKLFKLLRSLAE